LNRRPSQGPKSPPPENVFTPSVTPEVEGVAESQHSLDLPVASPKSAAEDPDTHLDQTSSADHGIPTVPEANSSAMDVDGDANDADEQPATPVKNQAQAIPARAGRAVSPQPSQANAAIPETSPAKPVDPATRPPSSNDNSFSAPSPADLTPLPTTPPEPAQKTASPTRPPASVRSSTRVVQKSVVDETKIWTYDAGNYLSSALESFGVEGLVAEFKEFERLLKYPSGKVRHLTFLPPNESRLMLYRNKSTNSKSNLHLSP
jgi:hypothetical protein